MRNRIEEIHAQQRAEYKAPQVDFNKATVCTKKLDDAVYELGDLKRANPNLADKQNVLRAIDSYDLKVMREVSEFFYRTSGIYSRTLRYMAFMYKYDWFVTPYVNDDNYNAKNEVKGFYNCLQTLEKFQPKKQFQDIALKVLRQGAYYGYKVETTDGQTVLQELPVNYCRTRWFKGNKPTIEFNMKYFDEMYRSTEQRLLMLNAFPDEFKKGYRLYKQGKLPAQFNGDTTGWYLLDPDNSVKFNMNGQDYPAFISIVPLIIDLDEAQDLDRKKTLQKLLKIVIQKMPIDKNGDLVFDVDEAAQLHNNAVQMLGRAIGVDVLTTFADVSVEDLMSDTSTTQTDDLERVERQVYNEAGVSQMLFNTDGNIALEKSQLNDAATMYDLLLQFEGFLNELLAKYNTKPKKIEYKAQILNTTIYNYIEVAKAYKEMVTLGYSKMLPMVAMGHTQSSILATAYFENDVLDLVDVFIPPLQSSTLNETIIDKKTNKISGTSDDKGGRPELPDDQKSTKTMQNKESAS